MLGPSSHPSNSNESLVKEDGRVLVHAAERVEGKRDEAKVMHITDFPTRSDMRLIEAMPPPVRALKIDLAGWHRNAQVQNVRQPISDVMSLLLK